MIKIARIVLLVSTLSLFVTSLVFSSGIESHRIRIENIAGGLIQVSLDSGRTYRTVGKVRRPAQVSIIGFAAASYTPSSAVAAVAVHGIRIKVGQEVNAIGKAGMSLMFSLVPAEFAVIPNRYGGHQPRSSGIETDIHTGTSIFRNLAPYVGSPACHEVSGRLEPLPDGYMPQIGDVIVVKVILPDNPPSQIQFQNIKDGRVTAFYADGTSRQIAKVVRPVSAIGRYDGTTFNGVGSINTNHGGVITVSTAPKCPFNTVEGGPVETRGGFMIQPVYHTNEQGERKPQVMAIAADDTGKPLLEGTPPLFKGDISLSWYPNDPEHSTRVQIRVDGGDWEPLPQVVGRVDDAFTVGSLTKILKHKVNTGITDIRLVLPEYNPGLLSASLENAVTEFNKMLISRGTKPVSGRVTLKPNKQTSGMTIFYVDGKRVYAGNVAPHVYTWDTTNLPSGLYRIEIETPLGREEKRLLVINS